MPPGRHWGERGDPPLAMRSMHLCAASLPTGGHRWPAGTCGSRSGPRDTHQRHPNRTEFADELSPVCVKFNSCMQHMASVSA